MISLQRFLSLFTLGRGGGRRLVVAAAAAAHNAHGLATQFPAANLWVAWHE